MDDLKPIKIKKDYHLRAYHWIHDSIMLLGILALFLVFGGAQFFGYYFDITLVPIELTQTKK